MNKTARKPKITMPCIVNSAEENPNPLIIVWLTEVTFISDDILISVLNTCQTYAALTEWMNYVLRNIDRVAKISRINKNDLNEFCLKLKNLIDNKLIRPTAPLDCKALDVNLIGYGDGDNVDVNEDPQNNLLINFGDSIQFDPEEEKYKKKWSNLPRNGDLITLIDNGSSSNHRHAIESEINIAKNMRTCLSQCDKKYTEDDIDCLTLDLLDKYISVENKKFKLNIYDKKGKLNKNGEVVLNVLHEKFPHVTRNRIKFHLEDHVKKSLSNFTFFDDLESEKDDFIFEMRDAVAYTLNQEKYFSPELYDEIKITHGVINGTFFTLHYFQCIFYGCMMYYRDADPQIRKSIIMNSFDIIEIFEKTPEEFEKVISEKINDISKPEEVLDFFIKSIYSKFIEKKDCDEIKTIIKQLYSTAYSKDAKQLVRDQFHVTQTNLLFPDEKKLFIDKSGKVGVGFPTIYELVMQKKLRLSPELEASYQNLPDEVKFYEYELTIADIAPKELQNWSAEQIIANIDVLSKKQLNGLLLKKKLECLAYLKDPNNNFSESDKQKVFQRFVKSDKDFIKSFSAKEFIDWNEYIDIDKFRDLNKKEIEKIEGLVSHLKRNNNLSINFIEKIFCSLEKLLNADEYKKEYHVVYYYSEANRINQIFDDDLFKKMVQYQDNIDLPKIFAFNQETLNDDVGVSNINGNNIDFSNDIIKNFLVFLYERKRNEDVNRLLRNRYFSRLIFQRIDFPISEILDFYEPWRGTSRLLQFPSKYISDLIKFESDSSNEKSKRDLAHEILIKKVNVRCELINEFSAKEIYENFIYIKSKTLNFLSKENFNGLIDQFLIIRQISFDVLIKIFDCGIEKLVCFIEPNKIFDLIRYSQIDNNSQQEILKKYFVDFFSKSFSYFLGTQLVISKDWQNKFFNYIVSQNFGTVEWVLNIFPQVVNYLPVEQIYDNFNDIIERGLITKDFLKFNELLNTLYKKKDKEKIKILPEILENNATLINDVNNNEMLINLMLKNKNEINEKLLNAAAKDINGGRFSQLIRWGKNNYSIDKMPENVKLIFFNFISKIDYTKLEFYNFDFESRVFMLNFYLNCIKNRDERFQNMSKKLLLKSKYEYLLKTINYVKNNSEENNFVNDLKEVILSEFANLPAEAMLKLSDLNMYKDKFFSIYSNNVSDEFLNGLIYQNLFMDYIDKINDMLKNENFKTKLEDYINDNLKIRDYELLELYKSKNESIINLISKERFIKFAEESWSFLNIVAKYTNKYFDDISDNILKKIFNDEEIYVIRAVSDEKFGEIFVQLRMECKENEIETMREILIKRYTPFITKSYLTEEEITNLSSKDNQEDILNALKKLNQKIKIKEESKTTGVKKRKAEEEKKRKEEEEERKRKAEEERKRKEEEEKKRKENENTEEKPSNKKRNFAFIIAGVILVLASITLLPLALLGFLSFGIGLGIAVGLFVIGTGSTGFGSKSFDNEKIAELMERDTETYTRTEKSLYSWRKPIKEHIKNFEQTDEPKSENDLIQKEK